MIQNQTHHATSSGTKTVVLTNKQCPDLKPITIKFKTVEEVGQFLDVIFNRD